MALQFDLRGKVALVTGGTRGIGRGLALGLARAGADVVINYRKRDDLAEAVAGSIRDLGRRALPVRADVEDPEAIRRMFEEVGAVLGGLDVLVVNAASSAFRPVMDLKAHNVDRTMAMIVRGYLLLAQEAARLMAPRGGGKVVAVSGGDTIKYLRNHALLAAAKAAMETLTRYLAVELADRHIVVNAVLPGPVDTDSARLYAASTGLEWEAFLPGWIEPTPYRRLGTVADIVNVVLFLCSPESDWIVGQCIPVDGGFTLT
jgi:enoyl-[acyl-carrier protein] reductase III